SDRGIRVRECERDQRFLARLLPVGDFVIEGLRANFSRGGLVNELPVWKYLQITFQGALRISGRKGLKGNTDAIGPPAVAIRAIAKNQLANEGIAIWDRLRVWVCCQRNNCDIDADPFGAGRVIVQLVSEVIVTGV